MAAPMEDWQTLWPNEQNSRNSWKQGTPTSFESQQMYPQQSHGQISQYQGHHPHQNFHRPRFAVSNRAPFQNDYFKAPNPSRNLQNPARQSVNRESSEPDYEIRFHKTMGSPTGHSHASATSSHFVGNEHNVIPQQQKRFDRTTVFDKDNQNFGPVERNTREQSVNYNVNYNVGNPDFQNNFNSNLKPNQHSFQQNYPGSYNMQGNFNGPGIGMPPFSENKGMGNVPPNTHGSDIADGVGSVLKMMKHGTQPNEENNNDGLWVKQWLEKRNIKAKAQKMKTTLKISEAQEKTRHMIVLLARLQKNKKHLESMKNEDKSVWEQKHKEVMQIKCKLEVLQKELTSPESVAGLQRRIAERRKKRERIKQRKQEWYRQHQEELVIREQKHAEIDKAMQQIILKQQVAKQEAEMQKEGDQTLAEVRKKLSDSNKTIQLLNCLQKMRKLRRDRLERQGVLGMCEAGNTKMKFETAVGDLVNLMNKQLDTYKAEEETLKVILETEHEETREKEREKMLLKQKEKQKEQLKKEDEMLFGKQKDPQPGDPLFPFRQYYDMASHSFDALVSIRQEWDMYLATPNIPGASPVPPGWIIPPESSSETWASALTNKTS